MFSVVPRLHHCANHTFSVIMALYKCTGAPPLVHPQIEPRSESDVLFRPKTCEKISAVKKDVKYHAFSLVRSAKKTFVIIIGKRYTLRMPGILKISVCRIPIPGNGFFDWLHGYYLCIFMLSTCTDKMADRIHCLRREAFYKY